MEKKSAFDRPGKDVRLTPRKATPAWRGPEEDGVTFSLLCRFLQCPERFRLYAVEGLKPKDRFNHRAEYGTMWHVCEEAQATGGDWQNYMYEEAESLSEKYPHDRAEIDKWYRVCQVQFPIYLKYWGKYERDNGLVPLAREEVFDVPYKLPSGRVVRLRGKRDGVYRRSDGVYLFETKTKGDVDEQNLRDQLTFDLQTMLYLIASRVDHQVMDERGTLPDVLYGHPPLGGVYYNVIRRPLSGGKGNIVRHKATDGAKCPKCKGTGGSPPASCVKCGGKGRVGGKPEESWDSYCNRLRWVIDGTGEDSPGPGHFFHRWLVPVSDADVRVFRETCLDPILERLCNWWGYQTGEDVYLDPKYTGIHWRMPFGLNLPLLDGGVTDYDEYLRSGSTAGLDRVDTVFRELV